MPGRIVVYFSRLKQSDRWFKGDGRIISLVKKMLFVKRKVSSLEMVFINLVKGLKRIGAHHAVNLPFHKLAPDDVVVMLGSGMDTLRSYTGKQKVIAGIGLMTHPSEVPDLFSTYPVKLYLQHSHWTQDIYNRFYGQGSTKIWPAGIDTDHWKRRNNEPRNKVLIYNKVMWPAHGEGGSIMDHITTSLNTKAIEHTIITYGSYSGKEYRNLLDQSYAMIFLCEHESQGMACQEALSMNVPVFAWNQGYWLDPNRFAWGEVDPVPASSVPYFNEQCGMMFKDQEDFDRQVDVFLNLAKDKKFAPRAYVLDHLTLEKSAQRMLSLIKTHH